ncbi:ArsA family ATPase [Nocardia goodfellowii]|uniref:Arsenite-transporting ATPase n=1 Tax=Nocardia goodfellowii TaxID=882446 RepID=A0ABS4QQ24_9NOCA|nr:ArsA family ATPase [Nocardia goodfellowii]MBP2193803.1 arsenite-transporting ATPase [Nocardia goodfellowii]
MTRLQLFVGKGGVGKTTMACATAVSFARAGQRVLIASLDQAHSLGDALGVRLPHDPGTVAGITRVTTGLDAIEVDSLALLEDRFHDVLRMLSTGGKHEHGVDLAALDPAELTGLPGVQELLMLVELAQFADEDDWDVLVVDCPPSADMLRIVTAPGTLLGYLERIWPPHARAMSAGGMDLRRAVLATTVEKIVAAVTEVRDLLADHARTGATLVTVAERVAVAETERVRSAAALLGLRLDVVLVNKILPEVPPADSAHPAIDWYLTRRAEQLSVVDQLRRRFDGDLQVLIAQHSGSEPVGVAALAELGSAVAEDTPTYNLPEVRTSSGEPVVRWESGTGLHSVYTLRMHLPVVDPATLRLGRVEDDVIVGADGVRRRVRLAPVLRRCTVDTAELDGNHLVLRFVPDPELWPR